MKAIRITIGVLALGIVSIISVCVASATIPSTAFLERLYYLSQTSLPIIAILAGSMALLELRNSRRMHEYGVFEATATRIVTISRLLLDNQEGYQELKTGDVQTEAGQLLAEGVLDLMDTELLRSTEFVGRDGIPQLTDYFADLFSELPGLRDALGRRKRWYSDALRLLSDRSVEGA